MVGALGKGLARARAACRRKALLSGDRTGTRKEVEKVSAGTTEDGEGGGLKWLARIASMSCSSLEACCLRFAGSSTSVDSAVGALCE